MCANWLTNEEGVGGGRERGNQVYRAWVEGNSQSESACHAGCSVNCSDSLLLYSITGSALRKLLLSLILPTGHPVAPSST